MFATLTWQLHEGNDDLSTIASEIARLLENRQTSRLLSNMLAVSVRNKIDYIRLYERLKEIADAHPSQFYFALFAHYSGSAFRGVQPPQPQAPASAPPLPVIADVEAVAVPAELVAVVGTRTLRTL